MDLDAGLPTLEGERVTLRPLRREDARAVLTLLAQPRVREWFGAYDTLRLERDFFDPAWAYTYLVLVEGEVAGLIQFHEVPDPDYKSAGIDILMGDDYQDRGLGTDALRAVVRYLIRVRGHHRLTMDPATANGRAIRAYEKVGFKPVGVMRRYERAEDGSWHDGLLLDLLAEEFIEG
jgi:aminoglycoside 6'-N-acetyltransferase